MNLYSFLLSRAEEAGRIDRQTLRRVLAHRLQVSETAVRVRADELELSAEQEGQITRDFTDLIAGRPEAHLLGEIPFLDWDFRCDDRALIPRPETEALCSRVIRAYAARSQPRRILDLCTGSGVLGLALALSFPEAQVTLTDLYAEALALAAENTERHWLNERVQLKQGDLWDAVGSEERFDLIVSNPPYVAADDEVGGSVLDWEPHTALYSENGGRDHILRILAQLGARLNPGGMAAFELGHYHHKTLAPMLDELNLPGRFAWERDPFEVSRYLIYQQADEQP